MNNNIEKNKQIAATMAATRKRRCHQICKSFSFKVDKKRLTKEQSLTLKMMFVEAKWVYNWVLSQEDIFKINYPDTVNITHKDKEGNDVSVTIEYLKAASRQQIIDTLKDNIKGLSSSKKKGNKTGRLKFKSEYKSIKLKQYGVTHSIKGNNRIKVQGIKQPIKVFGLEQLSQYENLEYTTANIINTGYGDYYITLACYCTPKEHKWSDFKNYVLGIDMGVKDIMTCSNGEKINPTIVEETEYLKKLQAKLARQIKGSNNYRKLLQLTRKEYAHINNKRNDIANKLVHQLLKDNAIIVIQDEQIAKWKENLYCSSKIHHSILGRIKTKLMQSNRVVVLDKWIPTTQHCFNCGTNTVHTPDKRTFICSNCGLTEDRDVHAAQNMVKCYISYINKTNSDTKSDTPGTGDTVKPANRKISLRDLCGKQEDATSLVLH